MPPTPDRFATQFSEQTEYEHGLMLPDNTVIWEGEEWHGRPVALPADRQVVLDSLKISAGNLQLDEKYLLGQYRWVRRAKTSYVTVVYGEPEYLQIDNADLLPLPTQTPADEAEPYDPPGDGWG